MKNVRCDLPKETANLFKAYCRQNGIKYEPSENGNDIHFECYMTDAQMEKANQFIDENC